MYKRTGRLHPASPQMQISKSAEGLKARARAIRRKCGWRSKICDGIWFSRGENRKDL